MSSGEDQAVLTFTGKQAVLISTGRNRCPLIFFAFYQTIIISSDSKYNQFTEHFSINKDFIEMLVGYQPEAQRVLYQMRAQF